MKFNERLKFFREKKGYTQDEIATKLNIARQSVSKWENGINEPDFETLKKLCMILDCSITELIDSNHEVVTSREEKDKKLETKLFYWNISLTIVHVLVVLMFIRAMNDRVIIHWDQAFNPTYGSKWGALATLIGPFMFLILSIIFRFKLGRYEEYYQGRKSTMQLVCLIFQIFVLILSIVMMCFMDTYEVDTLGLLLTFSFLTPLLPVSIFSHPKFNKRNPFFGVKTLFTLSSDEAWYKVNSIASIAMFIGCLSVYALYFILFDLGIDAMYYILIPIGLMIIFVFISHEIIRKKMK